MMKVKRKTNPDSVLSALESLESDINCILSYATSAANGSRISWADVVADIGEDVKDSLERVKAAVEKHAQSSSISWRPISEAPTDNRVALYLARIDGDGNIIELDYDGIWDYWEESYEMPHINGWTWFSANGIEEPTHWAYQYDMQTPPAIHQTGDNNG